MKSRNVFVSHVDPTLTANEIRKAVELLGTEAVGLPDLTPDTASKKLMEHLSGVYIASDGRCRVIQKILGIAHAHLLCHYPSLDAYLRGVNSRLSPLQACDATCMTGLAGGGKSAIVKAVQRLLGGPHLLDPGQGYPAVPLEPMWFIEVRAANALKEVLRSPLEGRFYDLNSLNSTKLLTEYASKMAFRHGVGGMVVDEWQFMTQGSEANALVTKLLLLLRYVGLPVLYVSNYSLCHRLSRRNAEDKHRLLQDIIVVEPEAIDDEALVRLYGRYERISGGAVDVLGNRLEQQLHDYTFGISRNRIRLLGHAYKAMRARGGESVKARDLQQAYESVGFSTFRDEVMVLRQQAISGKRVRDDLWCPFQNERGRFDVPLREAALRIEQQEITQQALHASMTPAELKRYREMRSDTSSPVGLAVHPKRARHPRMTLDNILPDD